MLFILEKQLENGSIVYPIIGGEITTAEGSDIYSAQDMMGNPAVFAEFSKSSNIKIGILPGGKVPTLFTYAKDNAIGIASVYNIIDDYLTQNSLDVLPNEVSQKLISAIMQMGPEKRTAIHIVTLCMVYRQYAALDNISGTINLGMDTYAPEFFEETKAFISSMNQTSVWPFTKITTSENVTKFQTTAESDLFIEIPARQTLLDENINPKSLIPKKSEVLAPYGAMELEDMTMYKEPNVKFPQDMLPLVEGVPSNNELEIQTNEQLYYDSLMEWVQFNMKEDAGADIDTSPTNPNIDGISQTYLEALCNMLYSWNWNHNANIPTYDETKEEQEYLSENEEDSIKSNYLHKATKREREAIEAGYTDLTNLKEVHVNALELLQDFLREASLNIGYQVYVEAAIKLARWGSRKPTVLFFKDYPLVFDLGKNKVKQYIGYIDNYELRKVNDRDATALCAIYDDTNFADKQFLQRLGYTKDSLLAPIGLIGRRIYDNKSTNGPASLDFEVYYSLIDVVRSYVTGTGEFSVNGIEYVDGKFIVDDSVICDKTITLGKLAQAYSHNRSNLMMNPFCASESLQNLYMDFNVVLGNADAPLHHFSILQSKQRINDLQKDISMNAFDSKEDLLQKREQRIIRLLKYAVETGVASTIIPIYVEVSSRLQDKEFTFTDVLNVYKEVMCEKDYVDEASFMNNYSRKVVVKGMKECITSSVESEPVVTNVGTMNLFGNAQEEQKVDEIPDKVEPKAAEVVESVKKAESVVTTKPFDASPEQATPAVSFVKELNADDKFYKLVDGIGNTVGGCAFRRLTVTRGTQSKQMNIFIFVDDATIGGIAEDRIVDTKLYKNVVSHIINDLYVYEMGKTDIITAFFKDIPTMKYYRDKTKELLDNNQL